MADKPPASNSHTTPAYPAPPPPPPPASTVSNPPFTPRSGTFPEDLDRESDDGILTPTQSPDSQGPHYDDLPPTYDEAQAQALREAQDGFAGLSVHGGAQGYQLPAGAEVRSHRATAAELASEGERRVPVQYVGGSENVPVAREGVSSTRTPASREVDRMGVLMGQALAFTRHEADDDVRFAPRLGRVVGVPMTVAERGGDTRKSRGKGKERHRECGAERRDRECERRGRRHGRGERHHHHVPGQWPDASSETLVGRQEGGCGDEDEPMQFLRAYAKALHAHSIRPAEFLDFLDGLNAVCVAAGATLADIAGMAHNDASPAASVVRSYIDGANEAFFAPRGLKVSIKGLSALLDVAKIPEERGQRAGAIASVRDPSTTPAGRAQRLHPWIEPLELNVPEPSTAALVLRDMAARMKEPQLSAQDQQASEAQDPPHSVPVAEDDPPHSIPGAYPTVLGEGPQGPAWPPFGPWQGRGGRGWGGHRGGHRGGPWSPFGVPGNSPFGPPGRGPFGAPGNSPFGPPGRGPFGAPGNGPFGHPGHGPFGAPGHGPFGGPRSGPWGPGGPGCGARPRGEGGHPDNGWEALGQNIGRWGEEFGKRMGAWGEQFGRNAQAWGEEVAARAAGGQGLPPQQPQSSAAPAEGSGRTSAQENGVVNEKGDIEHEKLKKKPHDDDDDDDASSISSDSDSDSDSESDSDYPNPSAMFASRIQDINAAAETARAKGKKPPSTIDAERAAAIEKASRDKTALEAKIERKKTRRAVKFEFRERKRELKREFGRERRGLRERGVGKKDKEWKEARGRWKEGRKELMRERRSVQRSLREEGREMRKARRAGARGMFEEGRDVIWVVVENLD